MSDYGNPINIFEYKYRKPVYYTNPLSTYTTNVIVKLDLNSENFNFNLSKDDGSDFRLLTGLGVLKMWKAYWSKANKHAILFFKLPFIGGDTSIILVAYWGNPSATDVSDPESLGFLFYETFNASTLSSSKWTGTLNAGMSTYGYSLGGENFTSITNPLAGKSSWVIEAGVRTDFANYTFNSDAWAICFEVVGTENDFYIGLCHGDNFKTNAIVPAQASFSLITRPYGGLDYHDYQEIYIDYYEPDDRITVRLHNRSVYSDVEHKIWRKVEGDTRPKNIRIYGRQPYGYYYGAYPSYINWLSIRELNGVSINDLDGRDLYVPYENVPAQAQDYKIYLPDFTSIQYQHESSFGGNPYSLSDEGFDADSNVWIGNEGASLSGVSLTIHTSWSEDVTSINYIHYDSGHDYYYNASKLSDNGSDKMGRNYWHCTTTSGWAAIKFSDYRTIGAFRIKDIVVSTVPSFYNNVKFNTTSMVHDYSTILNGVITNLSDGSTGSYWQTYYTGVPEWVSIDLGVSKNIWKVCLTGYAGYNTRMPKNFRIEASSDNLIWVTIYTDTAAPDSSINQFFTFVSLSDSYRYWRLFMLDNWGDGLLLLSKFELYNGNLTYSVPAEGSPKDFILYGSNLNPVLYSNKGIKLIEGTFENITEWQSRVISNPMPCKYYILDVLNTYGNKNIKIQEWEMMDSLEQTRKRCPSQLRLHPAMYSNWQYNFPKEISLQGSIDSINWTTLIPWMSTYTPFTEHYEGYGYWQRYSFNNMVGFWSFRLLCRGNWEAEDNKIIIGEWSLHELEEESYTYRILDGTTNNIQQIWATNSCGLDDSQNIIFIANEKMNRVSREKLLSSSNLPDYYEDFSVI